MGTQEKQSASDSFKAQLKALGYSEAQYSSYGNFIDESEFNKIKGTTPATPPTAAVDTFMDSVPDYLKTDPNFLALPRDMQEMAVYTDTIQKSDDADKAQKLSEAFDIAVQQADPYWKSIIRVAQDDTLRAFEEAQGDYTSSLERQQRNMAEIQQDLATNKEYLSLQQQQELSSMAGDLQDIQTQYDRNKQYYDADTAAKITRTDTDYNKQVEDITRNKEYLGAEEQGQLDKLKQDYTANRGNIINEASNTGLTFSTKRDVAMSRLGAENTGLVESTKRQFGNQIAAANSDLAYAEKVKQMTQGDVERENVQRQAEILQGLQTAQRKSEEQKLSMQTDYAKQIADLETAAARGDTEAQANIADLQRKLGESVTGIGRAAETQLGTANLPELPGYTPLGDVTGQVYEDKTADTAKRQEAIYNELTGNSLPV
jgi:hypothetical protein